METSLTALREFFIRVSLRLLRGRKRQRCTYFHNSFEHLLHRIPVLGVELGWLNVEVLADIHQLAPRAAVVDESEGSTSATEATSTPNTVQVGLIVRLTIGEVGDVVVDHHRDCLDVDTAGEDVGGDQDFSFASAELVEDFVTLVTFEGAGERGDFVAVCCHAALDLCGGVATLDEDDGLMRVSAYATFDETIRAALTEAMVMRL